MEEEASEKLAQLQHENTKLQNDLIHLQNHMYSVEEQYYAVNKCLSEKENQVKGLKQEMTVMSQELKEKELLIESLEEVRDSIIEAKKKLISENESLKVRLFEEKSKNKEIDLLKMKEEELKNTCARVQEENLTLLSELSIKVKEHSISESEVNSLQLRKKELEQQIKTMADALLFREQVRSTGSSENIEKFPEKELELCSPSPKSETNLLKTNGSRIMSSFNKEKFVSLREELLEAEVQDKQSKINDLEKLLSKKEEEEAKHNKLIMELKENLERAKLLNVLSKIDSRPDGQPGECKPLTEVPTFAVVVKDGVQTTQPGAIRIVETISIASQTDPIKILSPVLQSEEYEKFTSGQYHSPSDSDDEGHSLPLGKENDKGTGLHLFSEHKHSDLDMDIYRSCRKLSVLPEEEIDEFFNKKNSFKNFINSKNNNVKVKIHSADDVTKIKRIDVGKPLIKGASSCTCIITSNYQTGESTVEFSVSSSRETNFAVRFDNDEIPTDGSIKPVVEQLNNNELQLPIMSTRDALNQPHSFDSYLNPEQSHSSILARQISDPTQNTVFGPPITRRGSYIRKPRSTCRPLRFPCDKDDEKKEERVCKVRFDLSGIAPKSVDNTSDNHSPNSPPQVRNTNNVKMVSRFRVEVVDEVEFRKSIEETSLVTTRKRPSLKHSVMYKKAIFRDLTNVEPENDPTVSKESKGNTHLMESPDSPTYDTATESSPVESFEVEDLDMMSGIIELYPYKKRKQSDDDSQDSSESNDILIKSIKLHTNSECILMKDLGRESSNSSQSTGDGDIPFIDSDDLPVIKPNPKILKISPIATALQSEEKLQSLVSPKSPSDSSDIYFTPGDTTPVSDVNDTSPLGASKTIGLYKSPTVLKNLANFELLTAISESVKKSSQHEILEEEEEEEEEIKGDGGENLSGSSENGEAKNECDDSLTEKANNSNLKRTASDVSEASETDTLTYGTVRSHLVPSSDCESDTYVTIWSEGSSLERKCSDLSENSSSSYNTPPDTSSASFCTPPDNYSPVLGLFKKHATSSERSYRKSENSSEEGKWEDTLSTQFYSPNTSPHPQYSTNLKKESEASVAGVEQVREQRGNFSKCNIIFDSPKLEFYETNDSVENLEAFLQTEEGLTDQRPRRASKQEKSYNLESLMDSRLPEMEEDFREALTKRNSLDSPCDYKFLERRGTKRHPPLSRQNSTEDYNFLEPHDSCLNLSEEMSSPSTTPDTSNKTVIFKNVPLTVSNTIDLEDEDFPISEADIQVNFNGSQAEICAMPLKVDTDFGKTTEDVQCCRSEPCTPSISSSMDFPEFSVLRKQRSSFTGCCPASLEESLTFSKSEANLPVPPEIIVSNLSSESENSNSNSNIRGYSGIDFPSNVSERSEVHFSDVTSLSENSDNCGSGSEHSDNLASDVLVSDSDKSNAISPEVSEDSSPSPTDKPSAAKNPQDDASAVFPSSTLSEISGEVFTNVTADRDVCPSSRPSSFEVSLSFQGNTGTNEASLCFCQTVGS